MDSGGQFSAPPEYGHDGLLAWIEALVEWLFRLGKPLALGLVLLASLLAFVGYVAVRLAWRLYLVRAWRQRRLRRVPP
jgi:uncharacterized protein (DUF2062 family)